MTDNTKPQKKDRTVEELFEFVTTGRGFWLLPIVLLGLVAAALYRKEDQPPDTPFIYTLF